MNTGGGSPAKLGWKRIRRIFRRLSPAFAPRPLSITPFRSPSPEFETVPIAPLENPATESEAPFGNPVTESGDYSTTGAKVEAAQTQRYNTDGSSAIVSTMHKVGNDARGVDHRAADGFSTSQANVLKPYAEGPVPEVAVSGNGDANDRNKIPGIRTPSSGPFADPVSPDEESIRQADSTFHNENDSNIIVPIPVNVEHPSSIQEAITSSQSTNETPPPLPRAGSLEDVMHQQPPDYPNDVTITPPEGISMDCGVLPSQLHPPGQGSSRRRIPSGPREPERGEVSGGDGRTGLGWVIPFSADSRTNNPRQQARESPGYDSYLQSHANTHHTIRVASSTKSPPPQDNQPFRARLWKEYLLPGENLYYVHQGYKVVTDINLGDERLLGAMMTYLQGHSDSIPPEQELWLQDTGSREGGFIPLRCLIDHSKQSVVLDSSHETNVDGEHHHIRRGYADDRLNAKYRYWSFMEAHPAHTSLPPGAYQDAIDALNWASTDGLLPPHHSIPAPFTREECQSLITLLRSLGQRGETPLHTRAVSKILLRVAFWRRSHPHPNEPQPVDAGRDSLRWEDHPTPIQKSTPVLTAVVYTYLATTIFLCVPHYFMRIAGIGGILFWMSPWVSNAVAIVQSKVDDGSIVPHMGETLPMRRLSSHVNTD